MLIHRSALRLHEAAIDDPLRTSLRGVRVERHGDKVVAVATSGKLLATVTHPVQPDELPEEYDEAASIEAERPRTLPSSWCRKLLRIMQGSRFKPILEFFRLRASGDRIVGVSVDDDLDVTEQKGRAVDGMFPDWRQVTHRLEDDSRQEFLFNPFTLQKGVKVLVDLAKDQGMDRKDATVKAHIPSTADRPVELVWNAPDGLTSSVYIMPLVKR